MPPTFELHYFSEEVAQQLQVPLKSPFARQMNTLKAFSMLADLYLDVLIIDDFGALGNAPSGPAQTTLNFIRSLSTRFNFQIILIGNEATHMLLANDDQLGYRMEPVGIDAFRSDDVDFLKLLDDFENWCAFAFPSHISADKSLHKIILRQTNGRTRNIIDQLKRIAIHAIREGEGRITYELWRSYYG